MTGLITGLDPNANIILNRVDNMRGMRGPKFNKMLRMEEPLLWRVLSVDAVASPLMRPSYRYITPTKSCLSTASVALYTSPFPVFPLP